MTIAEQLQALGWAEGKVEGKAEGKKEVAINLLNEDGDSPFVARITGLDLAIILKLEAQLKEQ